MVCIGAGNSLLFMTDITTHQTMKITQLASRPTSNIQATKYSLFINNTSSLLQIEEEINMQKFATTTVEEIVKSLITDSPLHRFKHKPKS